MNEIGTISSFWFLLDLGPLASGSLASGLLSRFHHSIISPSSLRVTWLPVTPVLFILPIMVIFCEPKIETASGELSRSHIILTNTRAYLIRDTILYMFVQNALGELFQEG